MDAQGTVKKWWEQTSNTPLNVAEVQAAEDLFNAIAKVYILVHLVGNISDGIFIDIVYNIIAAR